ncbi:unnamed protein product [Rhizophagus irregularis]|nr:unnamed protein product [Rhizophagus irregularis]CAB5313544.1 unnamed protein product [Rhizophagus irregularis]
MSNSDNTENTAYIATQGSSALAGVGTNPTGKKLDENTAHVDPHKGSTALDSVGTVPENIQKNPAQTQPQPKNATEYVTGAISNVYTTAKETLLGIQSASTAKSQDQKAEDDKNKNL